MLQTENLLDEFKKRVIGQDHIFANLCRVIRRGETGFAPENEPKGAFLLTLHGTGPFLKCHIQGLSLHLFRVNLQKGANLTRVI